MTANTDNKTAQHKNAYIFVVHTTDHTARSICEEDALTFSFAVALDEARARWDRLAPQDRKDRAVGVYRILDDDYENIVSEGEGTLEDYGEELKVYALGYIEEASE